MNMTKMTTVENNKQKEQRLTEQAKNRTQKGDGLQLLTSSHEDMSGICDAVR